MHQGRRHDRYEFDPTQELPEGDWTSFQGIPHSSPKPGDPLELTLEYDSKPQPGPYQQDYVYPERQYGLLESIPDPDAPFRAREEEPDDDSLWRKLRRLVEPEGLGETGALVGASLVPGLDIAIDSVDLLAAIEDKDLSRALWATAGLGIPIVSGTTLKATGGALKELVGSIEFFKRKAKNIEGTRAPHPDQPNPQAGASGNVQPTELSERFADSPDAQRIINQQVESGIESGGHKWYETGGMLETMPPGSPGMTFDELHIMGGALSPQSDVASEAFITSVVNFARQNNIPLEEARRIYGDVYPSELFANPRWNLATQPRASEFADRGWLFPMQKGQPNFGTGSLKTPAYFSGRAGQGSLDPKLTGGMAPIDTHEIQDINYIINQVPELRDAAIRGNYAGKVPSGFDPTRYSADDFYVHPSGGGKNNLFQNAPSTQNLSVPYRRAAEQYNLPTTQSAQGARWEGGRNFGISIPQTPQSTLQGLIERSVREANELSNQGYGNIADYGITGGYDDTAQGLLQYWQDMREGKRFLPKSLKSAPWMR